MKHLKCLIVEVLLNKSLVFVRSKTLEILSEPLRRNSFV